MSRTYDYKSKLSKLEQDEKIWNQKKKLLDRKRILKDEKRMYRPKIKISTTKLIMAFILINCTSVEIYSMWVMVKLADISGLYSLITAVVGETISFLVYALKSTKENSEGGIVYENMKLEQQQLSIQDSPDNDGVG